MAHQACRDVFRSLQRSGLPSPNRGLLLDKFLEQAGDDQGQDRITLLQAVCNRPFRGGSENSYVTAFARWRNHWNSAPLSVSLEGSLLTPLAIGLGRKGVIEAGVRLSHSYGVPVIPGGAIKGALSSWVDWRYSPPVEDVRKDYEKMGQVAAWFTGRRTANGHPGLPCGSSYSFLFGDLNAQGALVCEDAWWVPQEGVSPLRMDIVTPHHLDYYSKKGAKPPSDTDEPVPVTLPVVTGKFHFVIHLRWPDTAVEEATGSAYKAWLEAGKQLLLEMLSEAGLGGKRTQGYGRFQIDHPVKPAPERTQTQPGLMGEDFIEKVLQAKVREIPGRVQSWKRRWDNLPAADRPFAQAAIVQRLSEWQSRDPIKYGQQAKDKPWIAQWMAARAQSS